MLCLDLSASPAHAVANGRIPCSTNGYFNVSGNKVVPKTSEEATPEVMCVGTAVIPKGVTEIYDYAFQGETLMTSIAIPDTVASIGSNGLALTGLLRIIIPGTVKTLGSGAFAFNYDLVSVIIPASVKSIGFNVFWGATDLTKVYFLGLSAPDTHDVAFAGIGAGARGFIPEGAIGYNDVNGIWKGLILSSSGSIILYDANGADTGTPPNDENIYTEGAQVTALGNTGNLERDDFDYEGWSFAQDGSGCPVTADSSFPAPEGITLLYAKWAGDPSVTYCDSGADSGDAPTDDLSPYAKDTLVTVLDNTGELAKADHTFNGWNSKLDGSGTAYSASTTFTIGSDDVVLYAQWKSLLAPNPSPSPSSSASTSASASPSVSPSPSGSPIDGDSQDSGGAKEDNSFNNPGDTAPALVKTTDFSKPSNVSFGSSYSFKIEPNGRITPRIKSVYVGKMTFVVNLSKRGKFFSIATCPAKRYRDRAHKICLAPKYVDSTTCSLVQTKDKVGRALKAPQTWLFDSCQLNQAGRDALQVTPVSKRPKLVLHLKYNRLWAENGKNKLLIRGRVTTLKDWNRTYVISFS